MNTIFKVIFSQAQQTFVVVSELAKGKVKSQSSSQSHTTISHTETTKGLSIPFKKLTLSLLISFFVSAAFGQVQESKKEVNLDEKTSIADAADKTETKGKNEKKANSSKVEQDKNKELLTSFQLLPKNQYLTMMAKPYLRSAQDDDREFTFENEQMSDAVSHIINTTQAVESGGQSSMKWFVGGLSATVSSSFNNTTDNEKKNFSAALAIGEANTAVGANSVATSEKGLLDYIKNQPKVWGSYNNKGAEILVAAYELARSRNININREANKFVSGGFKPADRDALIRALDPNNDLEGTKFSKHAVAVGANATATGMIGATALGAYSVASNDQTLALGNNTRSSGPQSTAIGNDSISTGLSSISLGSDDLNNQGNINNGFNEQLSYSTILDTFADKASMDAGVLSQFKQKIKNITLTGDQFSGDLNQWIVNNHISFAGGMSFEDFFNKYIGRDGSKRNSSPNAALNTGAIAIGARSIAAGRASTSVGPLAFALGDETTAIGAQSYIDNKAQGGIAIGQSSHVFAKNGLAVGNNSESTNQYSAAFGNLARAVGEGSLAVGNSSSANGLLTNDSYNKFVEALRQNNTNELNNDRDSVSKIEKLLGKDFKFKYDETGKTYLTILDKGVNKEIKATGKIGDYATAIGHLVLASGNRAIAVGNTSYIGGENAIGIGANTIVENEASDSIAIGSNIRASKKNSVALGTAATVSGDNAMALGYHAESLSNKAISLGYNAVVDNTAENSIAIGASAHSTAKDAIALGTESIANALNSLAIGNNSQATLANSTALGVNSITDYSLADLNKAQYIPAGTFTMTPTKGVGVVSVGSYGFERRISNVAGGYRDTDAVNVAQYRALENRIDGVGQEFDDKTVHYVSIKLTDRIKNMLDTENNFKQLIGLQAQRVRAEAADAHGGDVAEGSLEKLNKEITDIKAKLKNENLSHKAQDILQAFENFNVNQDLSTVSNNVTQLRDEADQLISGASFKKLFNLKAQYKELEVKKAHGEQVSESSLKALNDKITPLDKKLQGDLSSNAQAILNKLKAINVNGDETKISNEIDQLREDTNNVGLYGVYSASANNTLNTSNARNNRAEQVGGIAIGVEAKSQAVAGIAIGTGANSQGWGGYNDALGIALGYQALAYGQNVAIGSLTHADEYSAAGVTNLSVGQIALGIGATTGTNKGNGQIAIGAVSRNYASNSIAMGPLSQVYEGAGNSLALGASASSRGIGAVVIGNQASSGYSYNTRVDWPNTNSDFTVAIGDNSHALNNSGIAIGKNAVAGSYSNGAPFENGQPTTDTGMNGNPPIVTQLKNQQQAITKQVEAAQADYNAYLPQYVIIRNAGRNGNKTIVPGLLTDKLYDELRGYGITQEQVQKAYEQLAGDSINQETVQNAYTEMANKSLTLNQLKKDKATLDEDLRLAKLYHVGDRRNGGMYAIAIGSNSRAIMQGSVALGKGAWVQSTDNEATNGIALGASSNTTVSGGVALGAESQANRVALTTPGTTSNQIENATDDNKVFAFGTDGENNKYIEAVKDTVVGNLGAVSVGKDGANRQITHVAAGSEDSDAVNVAQLRSVANQLNTNVNVQNYFHVKIGNGKFQPPGTKETNAGEVNAIGGALGNNSLAAGRNAQTDEDATSSIAIGENVKANGGWSTAIGSSATTAKNANTAISIGFLTNASGIGAIAIGNNNKKQGKQQATGDDSIAIGSFTQANANKTIALGWKSIANEDATNAISIGSQANSTVSDGVAIGSNAIANRTMIAPENAYVLNKDGKYATEVRYTVKGELGAVSVGSSDGSRQIINVAAGSEDSDAVNVAQLRNVAENSGWNLGQVIGKSVTQKAFINFNDTVNFKAGDGLNLDIAVTNDKTANITYSANVDNSSIKIDGEGKLSVGLENYFHTNTGASNQADGNRETNLGSIDSKAGATGTKAVTAGFNAQASGENSVAIGRNANVSGKNSVVIGNGYSYNKKDKKDIFAVSTGSNAVAIGNMAEVTGNHGVAIGNGANVIAKGSALGTNATVNADGGVALGIGSVANRASLNPEGLEATKDTITLATTDNKVFAFVGNNKADNPYVKAVIDTVKSKNRGAVSVGGIGKTRQIINLAAGSEDTDAVNVAQLKSVANAINTYFHVNTGDENQGQGDADINFGLASEKAGALGNRSITAGVNAKANENADKSIAIGFGAHTGGIVNSKNAIAIGTGAGANAKDGIAMGSNAHYGYENAIALGKNTNVMGENSIALGNGATIQKVPNSLTNIANATALGNNATVSVESGIALGSGSVANRGALTGETKVSGNPAVGNPNQLFGFGTGTDKYANAVKATAAHTLGALSVGYTDNEDPNNPQIYTRQITHVAAGSADSDAVNVAQLKTLSSTMGWNVQGNNNAETNQFIANNNIVSFNNGDATTVTVDKDNDSGVTNVKYDVAVDGQTIGVNGSGKLHVINNSPNSGMVYFNVGADKNDTKNALPNDPLLINSTHERFNIVGAKHEVEGEQVQDITTIINGRDVQIDLSKEIKDQIANGQKHTLVKGTGIVSVTEPSPDDAPRHYIINVEKGSLTNIAANQPDAGSVNAEYSDAVKQLAEKLEQAKEALAEAQKTGDTNNILTAKKVVDDAEEAYNKAKENSVATVANVADAINKSGFTLQGDGDVDTQSLVNPGNTVDLTGKVTTVTTEGTTSKDGNIKVSQSTENGKTTVHFDLNKDINLSSSNDGSIDGLANHITSTTTTVPTGAQNQAATVGDVLNAGWNLQGNHTQKDFIKPYDVVSFNNGEGTEAVVSVDENKVANVTYNVATDGTTTKITYTTIVDGSDEPVKVVKIGETYYKASEVKDGKPISGAQPLANNKVKSVVSAIVPKGTETKLVDGSNTTITTTVNKDDPDSKEYHVNVTTGTLKPVKNTLGDKKAGTTVVANTEDLTRKVAQAEQKVEEAKTGTPEEQKAADAQLDKANKDLADANNAVATVANVAGAINNSGFTLEGNGKDGKLVHPGDTLDIVNGNGTTVSLQHDDGKHTLSINIDNGTIGTDSGKLTVDGVTINSEDQQKLTNNLNNAKQALENAKKALASASEGDKPAAQAKVDEAQGEVDSAQTAYNNAGLKNLNKVTTVGNVVEQINQSGFKVTAAAVNGGELLGTATKQLIHPGDTVTLQAGKNMQVKQEGAKFTYSTKDDVEFKTITLNNGDEDSPSKVTISSGVSGEGDNSKPSISLNGGDTNTQPPVVIKNVATPDADTDAANKKYVDDGRTKVTGSSQIKVTHTQRNNGQNIYNVDVNTGDIAAEETPAKAPTGKVIVDRTKLQNQLEAAKKVVENAKEDVENAKNGSQADQDAAAKRLEKANKSLADANKALANADKAVATVGNVANAINKSGFNIQENDKGDTLIHPGDKVNFVDGEGTTAKVTPRTDGVNVTFNINKGGLNADDGKAQIANIDPDLQNKLDTAKNELQHLKDTDPQNQEAIHKAQQAVDDAQNKIDGQVATVGDVVNTVNNLAWTVTSNKVTNSTGTSSYTTNANSKVKAGETVNINAGNNIEISGSGKNINIATTLTPEFTTVKLTNGNNDQGSVTLQSGVSTNADKTTTSPTLTLHGGNSNAPVRIENVAPGVKDTDAVNVSQLNNKFKETKTYLGNGEHTEVTGDGSKAHNYQVNVITGNIGIEEELTSKDDPNSSQPTGRVEVENTSALNNEIKKLNAQLKALENGGDEDEINQLQEQLQVDENALEIAGNKVATIGNVADVINKSGFNLQASGTENTLINPGHTVDLTGKVTEGTTSKDGNIKVTQSTEDGKTTVHFDLNKDLKLGDVENGKLSNNGSIDGLANHLDPKDGKNITDNSGSLPNKYDISAEGHKAANINDVLNAGWNLQGNGKAVDFVKPFDTVNFVNGVGSTVVVTTDAHKINTIKVNTLTQYTDAEGNPLVEHDGKYYPSGSVISADGKVYPKGTVLGPNGNAPENTKVVSNVTPTKVSIVSSNNAPIQLGNVAKGTKGTDAVNVDQLKETIQNATQLKDGEHTTVTGNGSKEKVYKVNVITGDLGNDTAGHALGTTDKTKVEIDALTNAVEAAKEALEKVDPQDTDALKAAKAKLAKAETAYDKAGLNKVATVQNVADAINNSGFTLQGDGTGDSLINPGHTVDLTGKVTEGTTSKDGNIKVTQSTKDGKTTVHFDLNKDLTTIHSISNGTADKGAKITLGDTDKNISVNDGKITHVAKGDISKDSTDAVNGSQIYQVKEDIKNISNDVQNVALNFQGDYLSSTVKVKDKDLKNKFSRSNGNLLTVTGGKDENGEVVKQKDLSKGNIGVVSDGEGTLTVQLTKDVKDLNSVTVGHPNKDDGKGTGVKLNANGSITVEGEGTKDGKAQHNKINIDANTGTIGGLTNTTWNPDETYTGGQAATQEQLQQAIGDVTNEIKDNVVGNLAYKSTNGDTVSDTETVKLSKGLDFTGGTNTTASVGPEGKVTFDLKKDIDLGADGSISAGEGDKQVKVDGKDGSITIGNKENQENPHTVINNGGITINPAHHDGSKPHPVSLTDHGLDNGYNRITHVAPGKDGTDAVNVNQLKQFSGEIHNHINKMNKNLRAGIAGAAAMSFLQKAHTPGRSLISAAVGGYRGEQAVAIGYSRVSDNDKISIKIGVGVNTRKYMTYGGSIGYQW